MSDIGQEFRKFLEVYSPDDLGTLRSGNVDYARFNAIYNRFKDTFDLWIKCPEWARKKHLSPDELAEVAKNPNIIDINSLNKNNDGSSQKTEPNSFMETLDSEPLYNSLKAIGIRLNATQVKKAIQRAEEIHKKSYGTDAARHIALNEQLLNATYEKLIEIENNPNLSKEEKEKQKDEQMKARYNIRKNTVDTAKKDFDINQPERALVRLARDYNANKIDQKTFEEKAAVLIKRTIELGRLPKLSEQLQSPMFMRLKEETKDCLLTLTDEQGLHFKASAKLRQKIQQQAPASVQPSQPVAQSAKTQGQPLPIQRQYES